MERIKTERERNSSDGSRPPLPQGKLSHSEDYYNTIYNLRNRSENNPRNQIHAKHEYNATLKIPNQNKKNSTHRSHSSFEPATSQ